MWRFQYRSYWDLKTLFKIISFLSKNRTKCIILISKTYCQINLNDTGMTFALLEYQKTRHMQNNLRSLWSVTGLISQSSKLSHGGITCRDSEISGCSRYHCNCMTFKTLFAAPLLWPLQVWLTSTLERLARK